MTTIALCTSCRRANNELVHINFARLTFYSQKKCEGEQLTDKTAFTYSNPMKIRLVYIYVKKKKSQTDDHIVTEF